VNFGEPGSSLGDTFLPLLLLLLVVEVSKGCGENLLLGLGLSPGFRLLDVVCSTGSGANLRGEGLSGVSFVPFCLLLFVDSSTGCTANFLGAFGMISFSSAPSFLLDV